MSLDIIDHNESRSHVCETSGREYMSSIAGRSPTGYIWPAGFTTKQHPESCYLQTRLMPCYSNLWGFLWPSYKSNFQMLNSSQNISSTINNLFWTLIFLGKLGDALKYKFSFLVWSSKHLPRFLFSTPLEPHFEHSQNMFPMLEIDINYARLMLALALELMNTLDLPTIKGALKHRRSTGCLCHGDSWSQRRLANPQDLSTLWTLLFRL